MATKPLPHLLNGQCGNIQIGCSERYRMKLLDTFLSRGLQASGLVANNQYHHGLIAQAPGSEAANSDLL